MAVSYTHLDVYKRQVQQDPDVSYWIIEIDGTAAGVINYTGLTNPTGDLGWAY